MYVTPASAQVYTPEAGATLPEAVTPPTSVAVGVPEHSQVEGAFPPMNPEFFASQILWLAITFGVFYYVLSKAIIPRMSQVLDDRRARIDKDLLAAESMRADADEAQAAYEQELAAARANSQRIAQDARDGARTDADLQRKRIEAELDGKLESAQARIAEIKAKALADVDAIAEDAAEAIVAELTGQPASREDVSRAVRSVQA